jgi:hypothetical protein
MYYPHPLFLPIHNVVFREDATVGDLGDGVCDFVADWPFDFEFGELIFTFIQRAEEYVSVVVLIPIGHSLF